MTQNNSQLIDTLLGVGLNKNEANIYLAILQLGPSSVWDISKLTAIKRPTCYVVLDELVNKNFAFKTNDGKRTLYNIISPKELYTKIQNSFNRFNESITELNALADKTPTKPQIHSYEGVEGLYKVLYLSLEQQHEILVYSTWQIERKIAELIPTYLNDRLDKNITSRILLANTVDNQAIIDKDKKEIKETKFIHRDHFNPDYRTMIFSNNVITIDLSSNIYITLIENKSIYNFERQKFELLWNNN